jgi:hypothetical protein
MSNNNNLPLPPITKDDSEFGAKKLLIFFFMIFNFFEFFSLNHSSVLSCPPYLHIYYTHTM